MAVLQRKKSKSSQYRYLVAHRDQLMAMIGNDRFPSRSTYFDRYRRAHQLFEHAIRYEGRIAIDRGFVNPRCVAVDQSLIKAQGKRWNKKHVAENRIPKGADLDATWTRSSFHGWVLGYSFEVVVTADRKGTIWPILASAGTGNCQPRHCFPQKVAQLPRGVKYVLADSGYDGNAFAESVEFDAHGNRTGRRFICPQIYRRGKKRPKKLKEARGAGRRGRLLREQRHEFNQTEFAKRLFKRRGKTIEPFNDWLKSRFDLHYRVWHRGVDNNKTQLLAAIIGYQLMLRLNRRHRKQNGEIQWIIDTF